MTPPNYLTLVNNPLFFHFYPQFYKTIFLYQKYPQRMPRKLKKEEHPNPAMVDSDVLCRGGFDLHKKISVSLVYILNNYGEFSI
jgi:hypothetical protein